MRLHGKLGKNVSRLLQFTVSAHVLFSWETITWYLCGNFTVFPENHGEWPFEEGYSGLRRENYWLQLNYGVLRVFAEILFPREDINLRICVNFSEVLKSHEGYDIWMENFRSMDWKLFSSRSQLEFALIIYGYDEKFSDLPENQEEWPFEGGFWAVEWNLFASSRLWRLRVLVSII